MRPLGRKEGRKVLFLLWWKGGSGVPDAEPGRREREPGNEGGERRSRA